MAKLPTTLWIGEINGALCVNRHHSIEHGAIQYIRRDAQRFFCDLVAEARERGSVTMTGGAADDPIVIKMAKDEQMALRFVEMEAENARLKTALEHQRQEVGKRQSQVDRLTYEGVRANERADLAEAELRKLKGEA